MTIRPPHPPVSHLTGWPITGWPATAALSLALLCAGLMVTACSEPLSSSQQSDQVSSDGVGAQPDADDGVGADSGGAEDVPANTLIGWRNRTWGGAYNDEAKAIGVASDGGLWIAGHTESVGAGDWDGLILRTDNCGAVTWARTYGAAKKDELRGIIATQSGGAAAVGVSYSFKGFVEAWVLRVDDTGAPMWTATYGGDGYDQADALTETTDADLVVLGDTYNFGPGTPKSHNMMLLRLAGDTGKIVWEQTLGGGLEGDAGFALLRTDGTAGNLLIAGAAESYGQGRDDVWLTKLSPSGKLLWSRTIGGKEDDEARTIAPDGQGGFLVSGFTRTYSYGKSDVFALRVDAAGELTWMRHYGRSERERAYGAFPSAGGIMLLGRTRSFGDGDLDGLVMRTSATGSLVWARLLRTSTDDEIVATTVGPDGSVYFAGRTGDTGVGQRDVWYGQVRADGEAGCNQHVLSKGKVKSGKAKPTTLSIQPTVAHGAVRRAITLQSSKISTIAGVAACQPTGCPK